MEHHSNKRSEIWLVAAIMIASTGFMLGKATAEPSPPPKCYFGIFRPGAPKDMTPIHKFASEFWKKPSLIMWYTDWSGPFPKQEAVNVDAYGAVPHIVWEPWIWGQEETIHLNDIISGKWDAYIEGWAEGARLFGKPIFVRFAHEFNIEKYPWGIGNNGKDPGKYVQAWRHVWDIFQNVGAKNVLWVWCFNNYPNPDEAWNDYEKAYPGDSYVDWIGIDGYNWGLTQVWSGWQTFKEMLRDQARDAWMTYRKPIMISEFASTDVGGDKAEWISEIPSALKVSMRPVRAIVWFDIKKEADWRIDSSRQTASTFKKMIVDSYFPSSAAGLTEIRTSRGASLARKSARAWQRKSSIAIDGKLDDWPKSFSFQLAHESLFSEGSFWRGPGDSSAEISFRWDEGAFYIGAKVRDNVPIKNLKRRGDIWNGDALEMGLGLNPGSDPRRKKYDSSDYQIGLSTGDGKDNLPSIWIWQKKGLALGGEIKVSKITKPMGYLLEAKIPWQAFGSFRPQKGMKLGFDIALDDGDGGERKSQLVWSGDFAFYRDPSVWGTLELVGPAGEN